MGIVLEEDLKRKVIDLAVQAARKRQSLQTGFVHLWHEAPHNVRQDTIPVLENLFFALALFRIRLSDSVLEAKGLLEKILSFEVEGNFPHYLHQYPKCYDKHLSIKCLPAFFYLLRDFSPVLGEQLLSSLKSLEGRILAHGKQLKEKGELFGSHGAKWASYQGLFDPKSWFPDRSSHFADYLLALQMQHRHTPSLDVFYEEVTSRWNPKISCFTGKCRQRQQYGYEPASTLFDLFMGEYGKKFSTRALCDSLSHLHASLVHPLPILAKEEVAFPAWERIVEEGNARSFTLLWKGSSLTHSLAVESKGTCSFYEMQEGVWELSFLLDQPFVSGEDDNEISLYLSDSPEHRITICGAKATTFSLEEEVVIDAEGLSMQMHASLAEGKGTFLGHVSKGNRSGQLHKDNPYEAFDRKISIRTIRRDFPCKLVLQIALR